MIDSATGMRPGERYAVENQERTKNFGGFSWMENITWARN